MRLSDRSVPLHRYGTWHSVLSSNHAVHASALKADQVRVHVSVQRTHDIPFNLPSSCAMFCSVELDMVQLVIDNTSRHREMMDVTGPGSSSTIPIDRAVDVSDQPQYRRQACHLCMYTIIQCSHVSALYKAEP